MTWITNTNKTIIATAQDLPEGVFGFVYIIENHTKNKSYIGKKQCFSTYKKKFGKKKISYLTDKRTKKYEIIEKETDWATYTGSNEELNKDIESGDAYTKTILEFAFSKYHLTYLEVKYQFIYEVLEKDNFYNNNILSKFFRSIFNFKKKYATILI